MYNSSFIATETFRHIFHLKPFLANAPIFYHLKTPERFWFSGVFRGYRMEKKTRNGLTG